MNVMDDFSNMCRFGKLEMVKNLLSEGADVHEGDDYPLRIASCYGHLDVIKLLLAHGANCCAYENQALKNATVNGRFQTFKLLIEHGADINVIDEGYRTSTLKNGYLDLYNYINGQLLLKKISQLHTR
jgi:ankyrin repeat protein